MQKEVKIETGLGNEDIDKVAQTCEQFLGANGVVHSEVLRTRISAENVMLAWQESMDEGTRVSLRCTRRFGKRFVELACRGDKCDPFAETKDDIGTWSKSILKSMGRFPSYEYGDGVNRARFTVERKKLSLLVVILSSILIGIAVGFAGQILPESVRQIVSSNYLEPLYSTYLNLIAVCGIPLIFLSVLTGILGVGNVDTFSNLGKKMSWSFIGVSVLAVSFAFVFSLVFMMPDNWAGGMEYQYGNLLGILLAMAPTGIFTPFLECNAMQLIILALGFGVALLILDKAKGTIARFMWEFQDVLLMLSRFLASFIPLFISVSLVNTMWSSSLSVFVSAANSLALTVGLQAAFVAFLVVAVALRHKVPVGRVLGKTLRLFLIATGTNSCAASIPDNYDSCAKMGIDPKVFSFGIPIGTTVFKPATAIRLVVLCFFFANEYGVAVSVDWFVLLFILSVCLSIAAPAIPGGVLIICGSLFTSTRIPAEALTAMLATDVFFDCICTGLNQVAVPYMLTIFAGRMKLLNVDKLGNK